MWRPWPSKQVNKIYSSIQRSQWKFVQLTRSHEPLGGCGQFCLTVIVTRWFHRLTCINTLRILAQSETGCAIYGSVSLEWHCKVNQCVQPARHNIWANVACTFQFNVARHIVCIYICIRILSKYRLSGPLSVQSQTDDRFWLFKSAAWNRLAKHKSIAEIDSYVYFNLVLTSLGVIWCLAISFMTCPFGWNLVSPHQLNIIIVIVLLTEDWQRRSPQFISISWPIQVELSDQTTTSIFSIKYINYLDGIMIDCANQWILRLSHWVADYAIVLAVNG